MRPQPTLRLALAAALAVLTLGLPGGAGAGEQAPPEPFPLPMIGGKPPAIAPGQKLFRLPLGFARVASFYREQFRGTAGVTLTERAPDGAPRELLVRSLRTTDAWAKAVIREVEGGTTVEVTPVLRADAQDVKGGARPLVQLVIGRSDEARKAAESIDHLER
ncbi:MAG TPA: hypothetical protein VFA20_27790 [Myxococcaceae bacterium]|nr:hypothetical protein [Myxococcaceae bacterium]